MIQVTLSKQLLNELFLNGISRYYIWVSNYQRLYEFFFEILINKSGDKYEKVNIFTKAKNWKLAQ